MRTECCLWQPPVTLLFTFSAKQPCNCDLVSEEHFVIVSMGTAVLILTTPGGLCQLSLLIAYWHPFTATQAGVLTQYGEQVCKEKLVIEDTLKGLGAAITPVKTPPVSGGTVVEISSDDSTDSPLPTQVVEGTYDVDLVCRSRNTAMQLL